MKLIDEFRLGEDIQRLAHRIDNESTIKLKIMEICGGHTHAIHRFGLHQLLPQTIELISGPGCPVCVTPSGWIDKLANCALENDMIITTYGDLIRVPGNQWSLEDVRSKGGDVRIVLSPLQALDIAKENPNRNIVFPAIGFETTAPLTAATILQARAEGVKNFFIYSAHKTMPHAMHTLLSGGSELNAFLCPGHVTAITGTTMYDPFPPEYNVSCVVSGFEPTDILLAILYIVRQHERGEIKVENAYTRAVKRDGNSKAKTILNRVFKPCIAEWRGLGPIEKSGLKLRDDFREFDLEVRFNLSEIDSKEPEGCLCAQILQGKSKPDECSLYNKQCTPTNPVGACMVSPEGACHAWYKYRSKKIDNG